jgi:hypothetical protein
MRPNYPISSNEILVEFNELQESLISLIGYDSNSFDNSVDVSGSIDTLDSIMDASGIAMIGSRVYDSEQSHYRKLYEMRLIALQSKRGK